MDVGKPAALADTLRVLLERGHALAEVLPVFTSNVADLLRLGKKGRIALGADADFVVLGSDHRVRDVIAGGRFLVRDGEAKVKGMFEGAQ